METTKPNGTFNGTLHHKGESPDYYVEQSARRPRRQRIIAIGLLALAPVFVAYAIVDLPRANTQATVTAVVPPQPALVVQGGFEVTYVWHGRTSTATIGVPDREYPAAAAAHPVGSTVWVHATVDDEGNPVAEVPVDQPVGGTLLAVSAIVGAVLLLRAARRNEAKGPLTMPIYLERR